MENELMIVNNNEIELTKEGIKFIKKVQKAKVELAKMEEQLKNMYYLNKNKLNKTSQYFEAKKCVVDFILILKDFKLDDDDEREEKRNHKNG